MPNPSTATPNSASAVVDEAVRVAAEGSRRTTESAQAALLAGRKFFDQATQFNRDLFALWSSGADAAFQTAFDVQNAAFASAQAWLDSSASLSKDSLRRWAELTRQAQATTLKSYKSSAKLFDSLTTTD